MLLIFKKTIYQSSFLIILNPILGFKKILKLRCYNFDTFIYDRLLVTYVLIFGLRLIHIQSLKWRI